VLLVRVGKFRGKEAGARDGLRGRPEPSGSSQLVSPSGRELTAPRYGRFVPGFTKRGCGTTLLLLRHGHSSANADDAFSGWLDVPLSPRGEREARHAAALIAGAGLLPEVVHTSVLRRSIQTANGLLGALGCLWVPCRRSWRLNERHYGALQGRRRAEVRAEVGDETYLEWRRSYEGCPPPLGPEAAAALAADPRYAVGGPATVPAVESLADVRRRLVPWWQDAIVPDVAAGRVPLVVGHSNSLRALCMILDQLTPDEVRGLNLPTGVPLRYDFDDRWRPVIRGGVYLDPAAAASGVAEVVAQGGGPGDG